MMDQFPDHSGDGSDAAKVLSDAVLLAALLGEASPQQQALIDAAGADARVAARRAQLARMLADLRTHGQMQRDFAVSQVQRERLHALVPPGDAARAGSRSSAVTDGLRQVVALLTFDSWRDPGALVGYRGSTGTERVLRYESDGWMIDLRVTPDGSTGKWLVQCECQGHEFTAARLSLFAGGSSVTFLLSRGTYAEGSVRAGTYRLELEHADGVLAVEPLAIGGPPPADSTAPSSTI